MIPWVTLSAAESEVVAALEAFGARFTPGGVHLSRTMMLGELTRLLQAVPGHATPDDYRQAVVDGNVLGKSTASTRRSTYKHLRELYGLSEHLPLFTVLRELVSADPVSAPLLAALVAWAREPLLRATAPAVLRALPGAHVTKDELTSALAAAYPDRYSPASLATIGRNTASTWTQSGHLSGRSRKLRCRVQPRPAALTLALLLAHLAGDRGQALFASVWCRVLDLDTSQARALATQAHREGLLDLRAIDTVVEIRFPHFARILGDPA